MKTHALNCNNCGAPLSVPETANYADCAHCGSQLAIHRNESARYTERIERLEQTASKLVDRVAKLGHGDRRTEQERVWDRDRALARTPQAHAQEYYVVAMIAVAIPTVVLTLAGLGISSWAGLALALVAATVGGGILRLLYRAADRERHKQVETMRNRGAVKLQNLPPDLQSEV